MAKEWQPLPFPTAFKGLLRTRQDLAETSDELAYASMLHNIEMIGGALGQRAGSQVVTGLTAVVGSPGWFSSTQGFVTPQSAVYGSPAFTVGQLISYVSSTGLSQATVTAVDTFVGGDVQLTVNAPFHEIPVAGAYLEQAAFVPVSAILEVPGTVNGFADPWHYLAVDVSQLYATGIPVFVAVPPRSGYWSNSVTVGANTVQGWLPTSYITAAASSTVFTLASADQLVVGDVIHLLSGADQFTNRTITAISGNQITITPALSGTPTVGWVVRFLPVLPTSQHYSSADPTQLTQPFLTAFAGYVICSFRNFAPGKDTTQDVPYPPLRYDPSRFRYCRHGLAAPTFFPTSLGGGNPNLKEVDTGGGGSPASVIPAGTYAYAIVERNSVTKHESPKTSLGTITIGTPPSKVQVVLPVPTDPQVDQVRIYRGANQSLTRFFLTQTITYPSTTTNGGGSTTSFTVASVAGFYTGAATLDGLYARIRYANGNTVTSKIVSIVGTTVTLATALPVAPGAGDTIWQIPSCTAPPTGSWTAPANGAYVSNDNNTDDFLTQQRPIREFLDVQNALVAPYPFDTRIPQTASVVVHWPQANRLVAIADSGKSLIFSDIPDLSESALKGESWPSVNQVPIAFDDGEPMTAVVPFYDALFIFKRSSMWRLRGGQGSGRLDIVIEPVSFASNHGAVGTYTQGGVIVDQNNLTFPAEDGFYNVSRFDQSLESGFESERLSREIDGLWHQVSRKQRDTIHGIFVRHARQCRWFFFPGPMYKGSQNVEEGGSTSSTPIMNGLIYQFPAGADGRGEGWATRGKLTQGQILALTADGRNDWITASTVGRFLKNPSLTLGTNLDRSQLSPELLPLTSDQVVTGIVGTVVYGVCAQDMAMTDEGRFQVLPDYRTPWFRPAGAGVPARLRALDINFRGLGIAAFPSPTLGLEFYANLHTDLTNSASVAPAADQSLNRTRSARVIFESRGEWHQLRWFNATSVANVLGAMVTGLLIKNWTLWFQPLAPKTRTVTVTGATPTYTEPVG